VSNWTRPRKLENLTDIERQLSSRKPAGNDLPDSAPRRTETKQEDETMTSRKPAHLLLVDDDPGLLKLLGMRLVSEGYSVVTAESGQEAARAG
jgi:PleD family two-component response regulator